MTTKSASLLLAVASLGATSLSAQITIPIGSQVLLAGYDFNGNLPLQPTVVLPRYTDLYNDRGTSPFVRTVGSFIVNGSVGTSDYSNSFPVGGQGDIDRPIASRFEGSTFDRGERDLGSLSGAENAYTFGTGAPEVATFAISVIASDANNFFSDIKVDFWAYDADGTIGGTATLEWFYRIGADGTNVSTGITNLVSGSSFTNYVADFSNVPAIDGVADLYLVGVVTLPNQVGLQIDNLAIYGTASVIPEPSSVAALAGLAGLGLALNRRRRRA